jgi:hypothetical protein
MSFVEFFDMLEALVEEERRQDDITNQRTAWQTAHIMNSSGNYRRAIQPSDLYKPMSEQTEEEPKQNIIKRFESKEQKEEYLKNLMSKFGVDYETDGSQ